ncbi:MAG: Sec-independent protein translocase protein TatB, partial [Deltaproteobacteria bacterium]|nr:Sec-independent protein translocase protein TatB [Deltaproteobacteria bacterium]
MILLILESIGTSELLLIGIVALIFLGPRRMPEIARKVAKIMAEFRGTANEFKETWRKEVDFEEEAKALDLNDLEAEVVARKDLGPAVEQPDPDERALVSAPAIKEMDPADFEAFAAK